MNKFVRALPLALIIAVWSLLAGCLSLSSGPSVEFREVLLQGEGDDKLLLIDIYGPIVNTPILVPNVGVMPGMTARIRQELEIAFDDPDVRGILLRINSPGGTLTDSDIIYHSLMEFKKTKRVKIIASMGDIAASGAVYIAMAADEIYAHPTTITGSIGVVVPHLNYYGLMKKLGLKSDPVTSGRYKDIDSPLKPRDDEERQMLQQLVDAQHRRFVQVIQAGRPKMTREQLRGMADGRLISAQDAKKSGLIDEVGYLDDAYRRLGELSGFPKNRLIRYANAWRTGNNIYSNTFPIEITED
ncbi:MAG: signal peptide peptidase SppA [SAR324 cluster bacterium]|nr:signal peptide peptidase SppA [SAR324 cluster bacterium]